MSPSTIKYLIAAVLVLHGLGHLGTLGGIVYHRAAGTQGAWLSDRSWLLPSLSAKTAVIVASAFWVLSAIGFVAAALSFWGVLIPAEAWRQLAVVSSVISAAGIIIFLGTWPTFNTVAAFGVNAAVLVTQLWTHWPAGDMFGN